jgi:SAM-dependent methyltransferase
MREAAVRLFVCPSCRSDLTLGEVRERDRDHIKEGLLTCTGAQHRYPISRCIPRFLQGESSAASFGFEWNKHPRTQLDSATGMSVSRDRFHRSTNWGTNLTGQSILEVGSGAGRFTEIALQTGAQVVSVDASRAVDANWSNNGRHPNLTLCQANLYALPFRESSFDNVFCFGVLQHTPDVEGSFDTIARYAKPGGRLAVDVYNSDYWRNYHTPMYLIRHLTRHVPSQTLYRILSAVVPVLMHPSSWLRAIPGCGRQLSALIPITNYDGLLPTDSREVLTQWSILDSFDTLSPRYISPKNPATVRQWFDRAGYHTVEWNDETVFVMRGVRGPELARAAAIA